MSITAHIQNISVAPGSFINHTVINAVAVQTDLAVLCVYHSLGLFMVLGFILDRVACNFSVSSIFEDAFHGGGGAQFEKTIVTV